MSVQRPLESSLCTRKLEMIWNEIANTWKKNFDMDFHNFDKYPKCPYDVINPNYKSKVFSNLSTQEYKSYSTMLKEIVNFQCLKIYIIAVIWSGD